MGGVDFKVIHIKLVASKTSCKRWQGRIWISIDRLYLFSRGPLIPYLHRTPAPWDSACYIMINVDHGSTNTITERQVVGAGDTHGMVDDF